MLHVPWWTCIYLVPYVYLLNNNADFLLWDWMLNSLYPSVVIITFWCCSVVLCVNNFPILLFLIVQALSNRTNQQCSRLLQFRSVRLLQLLQFTIPFDLLSAQRASRGAFQGISIDAINSNCMYKRLLQLLLAFNVWLMEIPVNRKYSIYSYMVLILLLIARVFLVVFVKSSYWRHMHSWTELKAIK